MTFAQVKRFVLRIRGLEPQRDGLRLRSDHPIEELDQDYFGFSAFAVALAEIIDNPRTATPLTVALSAPWGAGKTSVARMVQGLLRRWVHDRGEERPRVVCWFNAWEHDDAPHLGAALAAGVARTVDEYRPVWWRILRPLPSAMLGPQERWRRMWKLVFGTILVAVALVLFHPTRGLSENALNMDEAVVGGLGWLGAVWVVALIWRFLFSATRDAAKFIDDPGSEAAKGSMVEVKKQLGNLIRQARRGGRVVIFVDDLERCPQSRAVEVFEVAGQLLAHPGVVTVLLADMRSLSAAAGAVYGGDDGKGSAVGRHYLEKLVQLELELPPPAGEDMMRLLAGQPPSSQLEERAELASDRPSPPLVDSNGWASISAFVGLLLALSVLALKGVSDWEVLLERALLVSAGSAVLGFLGGLLLRLYARARRREIDRQLRVALRDRPASPRVADDEQLLREAVGDTKFETYAIKEAESYLTVQSSETEAVEEYLQRYPPRFPRGAKRMLNHARLLTKIARERGMFGGDPALTAAHLGKWIVISERWPDIAAAIEAGYRGIKDESDISAIQREIAPEESELKELLDDQPNLAGVLERLIYFTPADAPGSPSDGVALEAQATG
jgi:hypothetical protein